MAWSPYVNSSFQVGIIILCAVLSPIAPLLVGLRLWSRTILRSRLLWGDILIIIASVRCICPDFVGKKTRELIRLQLTLFGVWLPIIVCKSRTPL